MSHQVFRIENNVIIYNVSTFGQETIKLNGVEIFKNSINNLPNTFRIEVKTQNKEIEVVTIKSKLSKNNQILLDLFRNGEMYENNVVLKWGKFKNNYKKRGIAKLEDFELDEARSLFKKGLELVPYDSEIFFHLACINSLKEEVIEGIKNLELAIDNGFTDKKTIETHDKLAHLRIHDEFTKLMTKKKL